MSLSQWPYYTADRDAVLSETFIKVNKLKEWLGDTKKPSENPMVGKRPRFWPLAPRTNILRFLAQALSLPTTTNNQHTPSRKGITASVTPICAVILGKKTLIAIY